MSVNNSASMRKTKSGSTSMTGSTCIPVTSTANTASSVSSNDIVIGNATLFPQAAAMAKIHDKVKFHKAVVTWVPALPTTCGGTGALFFDTDRTDVGPTTMQEVMQNKGAKATPLWAKTTYTVDRKMLRSNEMFSTISGTGATAATNNTFTGPGRLHFFWTSQPGITYTTSTVIGFMMINYEVEFMFPSSQTDSVVPARRSAEIPRDVSSVTYNQEIVDIYHNFVAGCVKVPDFYTFLSLFDSEGNLCTKRAIEYEPDVTSLSLQPHTSRVSTSTDPVFKIRKPEVGDLNPMTMGVRPLKSFVGDHFDKYIDDYLYDISQ